MGDQHAAPAALLRSRSWRTRHSAWLLAVICGFGFVSFVGFLYCAIRVRSRKWWFRAAVAFAATVPGWIIMGVFTSTEDQRADMLRVVPEDYPIILWIVLTGYGFVVNRDYLRWRAEPWAIRASAPVSAAEPAAGLAPPPAGRAGMPTPVAPPVAPPYEPGTRVIDL